MLRWMLVCVLFLAGCVQLPPSPQDIQAKRFEPVADKAVIYIVRPPVDSQNAGTVVLDEVGMVSTQPRTYYRWETTPGVRNITGFGPSSARVSMRVEAGRVYFVQHVVHGDIRHGVTGMLLIPVDDAFGRRLVQDAQLL